MNDRIIGMKYALADDHEKIISNLIKDHNGQDNALLFVELTKVGIDEKDVADALRDLRDLNKNYILDFDYITFYLETYDELLKIEEYRQFHKQLIKKLDEFNNTDNEEIEYYISKCDYIILNTCINLMRNNYTAQIVYSQFLAAMTWGHPTEQWSNYLQCMCLRLAVTIIDKVKTEGEIERSHKHDLFIKLAETGSDDLASSIGFCFIVDSGALGWEIVNKVTTSKSVVPEEITVPSIDTIKERYCLLLELGIIDHLHATFDELGEEKGDTKKMKLISMVLGLTPNQVKLYVYNESDKTNNNYPGGKNDKIKSDVWSKLNSIGIKFKKNSA